jgi:uncharacterized caspase-like protein
LLAPRFCAAVSAASKLVRAGPRVALLIGISSYPDADAPLIAPKNDARVLADELKRIGFEVEVAEDLPKGGFHWAIENFKKTIEPGSTALSSSAVMACKRTGRLI